jgi:hypothetical protein
MNSPPPIINLNAGSALRITCGAEGTPMPMIFWRRNLGHVPQKCSSITNLGLSVLTCPDIQPMDSGVYSCEIINSVGHHFVTPNTILMVDKQYSVCRYSLLNRKFRHQHACISSKN